MLGDITFGQYYPARSPLHRMDPRVKLVLVFAYIVLIYMASNAAALGLVAAFLICLITLSRVPLRLVLRSVKPVLFIVLFTSVLNLFYAKGEALFYIWKWPVPKEGLILSGYIAVRISAVVIGSSLLTYTTTPTALTDGIERLLKPLRVFRVRVHELAMMMTIALRFIPTLIEETGKIMNAQKARGADLESGGLIKRAKALIPILIPLLVSSFRRAFELATAMECRCYHGGEGRTRMKQLKMGLVDVAALGVFAAVTAAVVLLNISL